MEADVSVLNDTKFFTKFVDSLNIIPLVKFGIVDLLVEFVFHGY